MDESRKQFEEIYDQMKHDRFGSNEDWAWKFWQASRAAIEIELPEIEKWRSVEPVRAQLAYRSRVIDEVSAAGIKVKE